MRTSAVALAWLLSFGVPLGAAAPAKAAPDRPNPACSGESTRDRIARVEPTGDIALASGRVVRLVDLRLAGAEEDSAPGRPGAFDWLRSLTGEAVTVRAVGDSDRWGRFSAQLAVGAPPIDAADLLVAEGLALVSAGDRDRLCRAGLLRLEEQARAAGRGVWAGGRRLIPARNGEALRQAVGRFVLVEGRVVSVGERRARTYLNFGRDFGRDFAATVPRRAWQALKRDHPEKAALRGRTVRVRGILEVRRGPTIEIAAPDMIELLAREDAD